VSLLRLLGLLGAAAWLLALWRLRTRRRLRNLDCVIGVLAAVVLAVVAAAPDVVNGVMAALSFPKSEGRRIVGLLTVASAFLLALVYVAFARTMRLEQELDRLVRELAKREFRQRHGAGAGSIYVILPAYNESRNLGAVLARIPKEVDGLPTHTLVVVDGATDDTERVVRELRHQAVSHVVNRGHGAALKAGYEIALEDGAEVVVTLDADGQHQPEQIAALVRPIRADEADLVNGSRALGDQEGAPLVRVLGRVLFSALVSALVGSRITDCSNSFRAIRASALARLDLRERRFHPTEVLIEAAKKGLRITEVPISVKSRLSGRTKMPSAVRHAAASLRVMISTWLR
jgi:hypothetical protein